MITYLAPLAELHFVLHELIDYADTVGALPGYQAFGRDEVDAILDQAARFCERELLPLNQSGDVEGCAFANGAVRAPKGFKRAYDKFIGSGWSGLICAPEHGGQGAPLVLQSVVNELTSSANLSFAIYPGLTLMAYQLLQRHGTDEQRRLILPRFADGTWSGTMCLTESHCGSDLGLIRTRAAPHANFGYEITGTKVFISGGEQDLTDNIVHMVLARLPGASPGTRGLSLFAVPKVLFDSAGSLSARNNVSCSAIEDKMGIRASATCVVNFDGAHGQLVGTPHQGMRAMFTMMNAARLAVGMQGVGLAETAYQSAVKYARERLQGRALSGVAHADQPADPIIEHADVRRMLLTMRAYGQGGRALALWIAAQQDVAARHSDQAARAAAEELLSLMTPIVKAFNADAGVLATNLGLQIFGGAGYIRGTGIEQLARDARIAQIYEGTNGIQALDLAGRKLVQDNGRLLRRFFHPVTEFIDAHRNNSALQPFIAPLAGALRQLQEATLGLAQRGLTDRDEIGAGATDYLRLFALVALAYIWARSAKIALTKVASDNNDFYRAKLATARFYMDKLLPHTHGLSAALKSGAEPVNGFRRDWY